MLNKTFDPQNAEARLYKAWEDSGAFKPGNTGDDNYCIVIPPPNVTGSLHIGHAFNNTLQDVLVRFERMRGKDVLWQVGTDHAGIATQMVVERQLMERQEPGRREMGREAFLNRVWDWKEESGGIILTQLRRLGASCDWSRERFTMDEGLSEAVLKVFVSLYKDGLIYRDKRLVNWDPKFETAISDLEVENKEVDGHFWHFKYPLENGETYEFPIAYGEDGEPTEWETRDYISIATTRPETMLGDGAVAVHPSDKRYAPIVGKKCLLPLADRYIPIITDEYPDPDFGSGAVKITGAHDFNDYQVAKRNDIPMYILMDEKARMVHEDYVPEKYRGMDRFDARKAVVADIDTRGLLIQVEDKKVMQPFGDRSNVVIEPMLTDQWYVDAKTLAAPAIKAVEDGDTVFTPKSWEKTYFQWMRNIEPWCISRQLWWGHQVPVWYDEEGNVFVEESEEAALKAAEIHHGKPVALRRDEDVLDTWFSSALWPFSTLGWPDETAELKKFYPNNVLVTAFDIIFFWVARMMMMGIHFMKDVPFKDVYIHALILDEQGQKMSKAKGNVIDPLTLVDKFGADAVRFTLAALAAQGRDIKLSESRVEGYRNFGTKLWNAARFCQMNECAYGAGFDPKGAKETVNQWILDELQTCQTELSAALEGYKFNEAAGALYRFVWHRFCDWYVELAKPIFQGADGAAKDETRAVAAWVLDQILILMHPFSPFITEELWAELEGGVKRANLLIKTPWPDYGGALRNEAATEEMDWVIRLISEIRSVRSEMNVPAGAKLPMAMVGAGEASAARLARHKDLVLRLARLETADLAEAAPDGALQLVHDEATVMLPVAGVIDVAAEIARLEKAIGKNEGEIKKLDGKLSNEKFLAKAPEAVVAEQRDRRDEAAQTVAKLQEALERLRAAA